MIIFLFKGGIASLSFLSNLTLPSFVHVSCVTPSHVGSWGVFSDEGVSAFPAFSTSPERLFCPLAHLLILEAPLFHTDAAHVRWEHVFMLSMSGACVFLLIVGMLWNSIGRLSTVHLGRCYWRLLLLAEPGSHLHIRGLKKCPRTYWCT